MRIGLSSYAFRYAVAEPDPVTRRKLGPEALLHRAGELGAQVVQFCDNLPLHPLTPRRYRALLEVARTVGVDVELGTRGLGRESLARYVELAERAGCRALRLVLDSSDAAAAEAAARDLLPDLHRAGVALAIENHADLPAADLADLVRRIDDPAVGVCLDTANSIGLLERPEETVEALAPLAVQVHVKDFAVEPAAIGYRVTGRPLGEGWLDLAGVLGAALRSDLDPDLCVELWMDPAESREATLAREREWVAASLNALRRATGG